MVRGHLGRVLPGLERHPGFGLVRQQGGWWAGQQVACHSGNCRPRASRTCRGVDNGHGPTKVRPANRVVPTTTLATERSPTTTRSSVRGSRPTTAAVACTTRVNAHSEPVLPSVTNCADDCSARCEPFANLGGLAFASPRIAIRIDPVFDQPAPPCGDAASPSASRYQRSLASYCFASSSQLSRTPGAACT